MDVVGGTTTWLLTQGVLGVACIALGIVIGVLYRENKRLQLKNEELQQARLNDVKETADKVVPVMANFSQTAQLLYAKFKPDRNGGQS